MTFCHCLGHCAFACWTVPIDPLAAIKLLIFLWWRCHCVPDSTCDQPIASAAAMTMCHESRCASIDAYWQLLLCLWPGQFMHRQRHSQVRERVANRKASFLGMCARSVVTVCGENLHRQMKLRRRFVTISGELALERSLRTSTVVMALPIAICHSLARHMDASTATPVGESTMSA